MRISDWSSDVCSSDLLARNALPCFRGWARLHLYARSDRPAPARRRLHRSRDARRARDDEQEVVTMAEHANPDLSPRVRARVSGARMTSEERPRRSEEHTAELPSQMRISYAVFRLIKKLTTISTNRMKCARDTCI